MHLTPEQTALIKRLLREHITDTTSNKTARIASDILREFAGIEALAESLATLGAKVQKREAGQ